MKSLCVLYALHHVEVEGEVPRQAQYEYNSIGDQDLPMQLYIPFGEILIPKTDF